MPILKRSNPTMRVDDLFAFILARHDIYRRRRRGEPTPWTNDPILQQYRFCNMYRELDKETVWIKENWRDPHTDDPDLWFALIVARLVNRHESLEAIGYPVPWDSDHFLAVAQEWKERKRKPSFYNSAYVIPAGPTAGVSKPVYQVNTIFNPMWRDRESLRSIVNGTLAQAHRRLTEYDGMGSFLAAQVIADLKYVEPLRSAPDWWTWAAPGPGSKRGLNRVLNRPKDAPWGDCEWRRKLQILHAELEPLLSLAKFPRMHLQDCQNALCEFDKMERARLGEGRPKQKYDGLG